MLKLKEKGFYKGVDLGGWLSQCDYSEDTLNNFIKEEDFKSNGIIILEVALNE